MSALWVYITAPDGEEAQKLAGLLVRERLAACVNIIGRIQSLYWWEGRVEQSEEFALVAKTKDGLLEELTRTVTKAHPYDVPCVVALPIVGGHPDFIQWIQDETR